MLTFDPWPIYNNESVGYMTPSTGGTLTTGNTIYISGGSGGSTIVSEQPPPIVFKPKDETPEQWLHRRIEEICWKP